MVFIIIVLDSIVFLIILVWIWMFLIVCVIIAFDVESSFFLELGIEFVLDLSYFLNHLSLSLSGL